MTLAIVPLALFGIVIPIDVPWLVAHAVLAALMRYLEWLAALPLAAWASHAPIGWTVAVAIAGLLWLLAPRGDTGSRARRGVDAADGLAAAAGRSRRRRSHRRAGRGPGARGARRHRAPRACLRYRAALQRQRGCRRANRRAVPARGGRREARCARRQPRGHRPFRRRTVDPARGSGRPADLVAAGRSSDRGDGNDDESPGALRSGRPLGMGRRPLRSPASCSIGLWRGGAEEQRSLVRAARRGGRRQRAADR